MQVKVWNDHDQEYKEEFRGKEVVIPAKGFVEMTNAEARTFLGKATSIKINGAGKHLNPKKLRVEKPAEEFAEKTDQPLRYAARDGKQFRTKVGLAEYEATLPKEVVKNESGPVRRKKVKTLR
jgi:hypothetical protein